MLACEIVSGVDLKRELENQREALRRANDPSMRAMTKSEIELSDRLYAQQQELEAIRRDKSGRLAYRADQLDKFHKMGPMAAILPGGLGEHALVPLGGMAGVTPYNPAPRLNSPGRPNTGPGPNELFVPEGFGPSIFPRSPPTGAQAGAPPGPPTPPRPTPAAPKPITPSKDGLDRAARRNDIPSPALENSPYSSSSVEARVRPPYRANPAHDPNSPSFNPRKTPEPSDAAEVYRNAVQVELGTWYGIAADGTVYRFFSDNAGGVHFSAIFDPAALRKEIRVQLGL